MTKDKTLVAILYIANIIANILVPQIKWVALLALIIVAILSLYFWVYLLVRFLTWLRRKI